MIQNPQIFIIYLPGMFGTLLANILMHHELFDVEQKDFGPNTGKNYNSHNGPYNDLINDFHSDIMDLFDKSSKELTEFFSPVKNIPLGVHRLCDYRIAPFNFEKYFSNTLRVILLPKNTDDLNLWGERNYYSAHQDITKDFYYPLIKKGLKNLPKKLIEGLGVKEKQKYTKDSYKRMVEVDMPKLKNKNCIFFDPKNISKSNDVQDLMDKICDNLKISKFKIPSLKINKFLETNSIFLNKLDQ